MNFLLDTSAFLWLITDSPNLPRRVRDAFQDRSNGLFLSAVSIWEILVKHRLGKLPLPDPVESVHEICEERKRHLIEPLALDEGAVTQLARLPAHHRDPFDRMLICQAIHHGMTLLTPDPAIRQYPVRTVW